MRGALTEVLEQKDIPYRTGVLTATISTFRIGGRASLLIEPRCTGELIQAVQLCERMQLPFAVIGQGSNILFDDSEINTVLIRTLALDAIRVDGSEIHAACGASLMRLSNLAAARGLVGLCFAAGIPGTVGGGAFMNAGAEGHALSDVIKSVQFFSLESNKVQTLFAHQLNYSYRNSDFQNEKRVILSVTLALGEGGDPLLLQHEIEMLRAKRKAAQPLHQPSAGSVFRRPAPDIPLSKIIDELGLKGVRVGDAAVSEKHAGFIVNLGNARAADVKELISQIQNIVEKERGIRPRVELRFIPE